MVTNQHLKYITDEKEISQPQDTIITARYLMQNNKETKERQATRLSRQMELTMEGDKEARKQLADEEEIKKILEEDGTKLASMLSRPREFQMIKEIVLRVENSQTEAAALIEQETIDEN